MDRENYPLKYNIKLIGPSKSIDITAPVDTNIQVGTISSRLLKLLGYRKEDLHRVSRIEPEEISLAYIATIKVISKRKKFNFDFATYAGLKQPLVLGSDFLRKVDNLVCYLKDFSHLYMMIRQSKRKCVLIIGDDNKNLDALYIIKGRLRLFGYEGILLKDYQDIEEQSIEEKMNLLGNLAKFVVCENSYPSGHIDELNICTRNRLVTIILQQKNIKGGATWMQACYPIDFSFVKRVFYKPLSFISAIDKAVKIAESIVIRRKEALNREYKYREEWLNSLSKEG